MIRARFLGAALALATLASLHVAGPATAQSGERLDLVSQTTFITDDAVEFTLRIPNLGPERALRVQVAPPREDPLEIAEMLREPLPELDYTVADFRIEDLESLVVGSSNLVSVVLPDEEIGLFLRREPGALPVRLDLVDPNGVVLDTLLTALILEDTTLSARIDLGFVADGRSPLSHTTDGIAIDPDAAVERVATAIDDAPGPVLVSFTPETLTALADPGTTGGLSAIDDLRRLLDPHLIPLTPWVSVDEEAWRLAGETDRVIALYARGQATTEEFLGRTPTPIVWMDADTTPDAVSFLRSVGVSGGIVEPEQLDALTIQRADDRPIEVLDANAFPMPVLVVDRAFEQSLVGDDPELVAQHRFTELLFQAKTVGTDRAILLDLESVDRIPLLLLLELIDTTDRLGVTSVDQLITRPPARDAAGAVLRIELAATEPPDVSGAASDLRLTESVLDSYIGMVSAEAAPVAPLRTGLTVAMSDELDAEQRQAFTGAVFAVVTDGTTDFEVVESSRVTLATRTATLPVTIRNDQDLPINVIVRISSEKLRFPGGDQLDLTLEPGLNELAIPVETVASGDSRILISLTSPDGRLDLASGSVNIRSTAISGLGLVVSLISLAILLTWWARTILRVRRTRRAATVPDDPSAAAAADEAGADDAASPRDKDPAP